MIIVMAELGEKAMCGISENTYHNNIISIVADRVGNGETAKNSYWYVIRTFMQEECLILEHIIKKHSNNSYKAAELDNKTIIDILAMLIEYGRGVSDDRKNIVFYMLTAFIDILNIVRSGYLVNIISIGE